MLTTKKITAAMLVAGAMVVSTNACAWSNYSYSGSNYSGDGSQWTSSSYDSNYTNQIDSTVTAWSNDGSYGHLKSVELNHDSYGYKVNNRDGQDDGYQSMMSTNYDKDYVENHTYTDSVLFDYGNNCVVLDEIAMTHRTDKYGNKYDADVAVLAYLGSKKGDEFKNYLAGKTYDDLMASNEWKVFQVDDKYGDNGDVKNFNGTDKIAASQWLVMAHGTDSTDDYFKIKHMGGYQYTYDSTCGKIEVKCTPTHGVPEPQSLALLGLGLLGLVATRRRKA